MQFTATLILLITAITGASAASIDPRSNPPIPPKGFDANRLPPRKDQVDGVVCNIHHLSKTGKIFYTGRHTPDGAYRYLNGLKGNAVQSAGPGRCTRVSCAHNLGVYFCNDNRHRIKVPWSKIAKYTNDIGMVCGHGVHLPNKGRKDPYGNDHFGPNGMNEDILQNGQKFSKDHWSVFINGDRC
ncbi:hypothetical protein K4K49_010957 [Colletotrichum sp. SAR 10_70]|nr:hypothetical protein KHU50_009907 [Colletotrichum sp. SAR 10_65]KAI8164531.1 hypothetical protein K4K50_011835 [Colletotrichum sp. SAR 10_71]KAI8182272.1 hypothetical protein K4K51_001147 [Colletotrichum sp. SAR 10_75]KAI8193303.1 hypothetical protein K4K49_010957 [Colletotrichum sp. SAR 10_70]KAI8205181.1 hypothetical protein K4K52_004427 [Colletotrichum sp. SAR 10_76]KAI8226110.1 hypothetical protein K4K54_004082 [Colletotrichum sp. SAR 10_86]KAI8260589.1 hypothetical protein K4K53_00166